MLRPNSLLASFWKVPDTALILRLRTGDAGYEVLSFDKVNGSHIKDAHHVGGRAAGVPT